MEKKLSEIRSRIDVLLDDIEASIADITMSVDEIKELMVESGEAIRT